MKALKHILYCGMLVFSTAGHAADPAPKYKSYKLSTLMLGRGATAKDSPEWFVTLGDYKARNVPVYFGSCLETRYDYDLHGRPILSSATYFKHMIFFPPRSSDGSYTVAPTGRGGIPNVPLHDFSLNGGRISIKTRVVMETIWQGQWAGAVFTINTEYFLRKKMLRLVQPADFVSAIEAPAKIICPDHEGYYWGNLDEYYKKQNWTTPPPLPGR